MSLSLGGAIVPRAARPAMLGTTVSQGRLDHQSGKAGMSPKAASALMSETDVAEALDDVLADTRLQTDLPETLAGDAGFGVEHVPQPPPAPERLGSDFPFGFAESGVLEIVIWVIVIGGLGYLLFLFFSAFGAGRRRDRTAAPAAEAAGTPETDAETGGAPSPVHEPVGAAMALAEQGRFLDAVRLLQRAAVDLLEARGHAVYPAATSREIHRSLHRADGIDEVFGTIVRAVERALFRGEAIQRADVDRCAASFAAFRDSLGNRRP